MSWIEKQPVEVLRTWACNAAIPLMVSGKDGEIYWANPAFEEWSGYTLGELMNIGWKKLSLPDDSLEADIKATAEEVDGYRTHFTVQKYHIPKNEKPQAGELTAIRYPVSGEIQFFLCSWQPLKNGTAAAFDMAVRHIEEVDKTVAHLVQQIDKVISRNEDEDWIISTWRIGKRYPKIAALMIALFASVFGLNNILELFQRFGAVGVPVPPALKETDALQLPRTEPLQGVAQKISNRPQASFDSRVTTPGGSVVEWSSENAQLPGPVGRSGLSGSGSRFISSGG